MRGREKSANTRQPDYRNRSEGGTHRSDSQTPPPFVLWRLGTQMTEKVIEDMERMGALMKAFKSNDASSLEVCNSARDIDFDLIAALLECCPSPCGHSSQYAYSEDGGAHIVCLLCERERAVPEALTNEWIACDAMLPIGVEKQLLLYGDCEMLIMGIFNTPSSQFLGWDAINEDWAEIPNRVTHWRVIPATPERVISPQVTTGVYATNDKRSFEAFAPDPKEKP